MAQSQTAKSPQLAMFRVAARQLGVVSLRQLSAVGVHPETARGWAREGKIERVRTGIYALPGFADCWERRVMAAVLAAPPGSAASHHTAARLAAFDGFREAADIHLSAPRGVRVVGVRVHQLSRPLPRQDSQRIAGIPTTTPTRTLIDLASEVPPDHLELALEYGLRKHLMTLAHLERRMAAAIRTGPVSAEPLRALLARRGNAPATESLAETRMLQLLRQTGLPEPQRQYAVGRHRLDFAWPRLALAIEADSVEAHGGQLALIRDLDRQNTIVLDGWLILRYPAARILNSADHPQIVAEVRAAYLQRAA